MSASRPSDTALRMRPLRKPASLVDTASTQLRREIEAQTFPSGAQLPTEAELCTLLGVSRATVREAVSQLRADGLLVTVQGRGTFVATGSSLRPFRIEADELETLDQILHVVQLRMSVEAEAAALAAQARTNAQLADMRRLLRLMDGASREGRSAPELDLEFHAAIAAATGNPLFLRFVEFVGPKLIPRGSLPANSVGPEFRAYLEGVQAEHHAIADAIAARDAGAARAAARLHLEHAYERYRRLRELSPRRTKGGGNRRST
jgi:GntR family transcriptional repressor for pyruvate dehydrogenase complex